MSLSKGRILEADSHSKQSDKEILEKYKVTKVALNALKGLKKKYGSSFQNHMEDVKSKVKYFSGYVMQGNPIKKLSILKKKLNKARSLILRKKKLRKLKKKRLKKKMKEQAMKKAIEKVLGKNKPKKKRKLFLKKLFKGAADLGKKALLQIELLKLLETEKSPPLKKLLKTLEMPKKRKYLKKLGFGDMNAAVRDKGLQKVLDTVKGDFKKKGYVLKDANWMKVIGFGPSYEKNVKKLNKNIKKALRVLKMKKRQINLIKSKLKKAIAKNNKEFNTYKKTVKTPPVNEKRFKNRDVRGLDFEPNVNVEGFLGVNNIDCGFQMRSFIYRTVSKSKLKKGYCMHVYKNFRKVRIKELEFYTKLARKEMLAILSMKRSLYCGICDATLQNNFDDKHKLILYSQRFCHDLVSQYKDYLKFRHIILIEFYDQFFQMISCFEFKNELGVDYPYRTMLESRKRRIASIRRCFENLNSPDFYKYCYFVCSQFNLIKFSTFFDGDLELLKTLYAKFTMFFRRYKIYRKNFLKTIKKKKKKKKKKKNNRLLKIKKHKSMKEAFVRPTVQTETGLAKDSQLEKKDENGQEKENKIVKKVKKRRKRKKKMGRMEKEKMKSLKKHFDRVNDSLTDQISMLVMNHKKRMNQKRKELSDRKKYIKNYTDSFKGKKILSEKRKVNKKIIKKKPVLKIDTPADIASVITASPEKESKLEKSKTQVKTQKIKTTAEEQKKQEEEIKKEEEALKEKTKGLWGDGRVLASDITQTFSDDLQNSFFEERLQEESKREAELTQKVKLVSEDEQGRELNLKLKNMKEHTDHPVQEINKKIKKPKKKFSFSYIPKKKKTFADKVRQKMSYLRFHTEGDRLPVYYNYQINPKFKKSFVETAYSKSIYLKTYLPFEIKTFRPFFAGSIHGFNPLRTTEMMRLDFDPRQIIALTRKRNYKPEKLDARVLRRFFAFDREDLAGFKNDVNLKVNVYGDTREKNYSKRTVWPKFKILGHKKYKKQFKRDDSKPFKPQRPWEFSNPDMRDLHGHYRNNTSNDPHGYLWHRIFGR